jgi:hypothetical protein
MATISRWVALALVLAAAGGGCAGAPEARPESQVVTPETRPIYLRNEPGVHVTAISEPVDKVWRALPEAYRLLGLPGEPAAGVRHALATPNMRITGRLYPGEANSKYLDCGESIRGPRADTHEIYFNVTSRVRAHPDGGSVVETVLDGNARDPNQGSNPVKCTGKGVLEKMIGDAVIRSMRS